MNNKDILVTPVNIQGELIKNEIEFNDLQFQTFKEQKYNELLKENQQLKEMFEDSKTFSKQFLYKHNKNLLEANEKLRQENEELKFIVGLRQKRNLIRKFDKEYDAEDKEKNPTRDYAGITPDAEVVYQRYYKQKEVIEEVRKSLEDYQEYIDEVKEFYSDLEDDDVVKVSNLQILNNQMVRNYDLLQILDKVKGE